MNKNFQAFKLSDAKKDIEDLACDIAEHTILLFARPNSIDIDHWRIEIISWLDKVKIKIKVKTRSKILNRVIVSGILYERPLGEDSDIISRYKEIIGKEDEISPWEVDISKLDIDAYIESLSNAYEVYLDYIYGKISKKDLLSKMKKFKLIESKFKRYY